jgi:hypothetical protein
MPGSVSNAAPTTVLPWSLCKTFSKGRDYPVLEAEYQNGEYEASCQTATSRKTWAIGKRLTPGELDELRDFYNDCGGPHVPFYFYDPWETSPLFSYDEDGEEVTGRHVVRFEGPWSQSVGIARSDVQITLVELA